MTAAKHIDPAELARLAASGLSRPQLAAAFAVSVRTLEKHLIRQGISTCGKRGVTAPVFKITDDTILNMLTEGRARTEIARIAGVNKNALDYRIRRMGLADVKPVRKAIVRTAPSANAFRFSNPFGL
jgi:DNA-binding CsgD family transcriptional regulator